MMISDLLINNYYNIVVFVYCTLQVIILKWFLELCSLLHFIKIHLETENLTRSQLCHLTLF